MKNNKGGKTTRKIAEKAGNRPRETRSFGFLLPSPTKKNCHAGRKSRDSPCSVFLVKPKNKKKPLDLQHQ